MEHLLFYILTTIMLGAGLGVVLNRNPVASALCLLLSFLGLAGLFIQLSAFFIGIIQILVYAGAVMVLFIFIIMLLDVKEEKKSKINLVAVGSGLFLVLFFIGQMISVVGQIEGGDQPLAEIDTAKAAEVRLEAFDHQPLENDRILENLQEGQFPDVQIVGETLFTQYNFQIQMIAVLLLISSIGVVLLSKKRLT